MSIILIERIRISTMKRNTQYKPNKWRRDVDGMFYIVQDNKITNLTVDNIDTIFNNSNTYTTCLNHPKSAILEYINTNVLYNNQDTTYGLAQGLLLYENGFFTSITFNEIHKMVPTIALGILEQFMFKSVYKWSDKYETKLFYIMEVEEWIDDVLLRYTRHNNIECWLEQFRKSELYHYLDHIVQSINLNESILNDHIYI